jgi:TIR domain
MQIFLSYAQEDRTIYSELCKMLLAGGQSYWDADSMPLGAMLQDKLREGIRACDACLFVATQHSIASKWCLAELGAFWGAGKPVIPYIADPAI